MLGLRTRGRAQVISTWRKQISAQLYLSIRPNRYPSQNPRSPLVFSLKTPNPSIPRRNAPASDCGCEHGVRILRHAHQLVGSAKRDATSAATCSCSLHRCLRTPARSERPLALAVINQLRPWMFSGQERAVWEEMEDTKVGREREQGYQGR